MTAIGKFFSFIFDLLYNQFAWSYDFIAWIVSAGLWKKWGLSTLNHLPDSGCILELGFGPGHLLTQGLLLNKNMVGVDISPYMVKICANRLTDANLPLRITQADSTELPYKSGTFSSVIATFPAPYILQTKTLTEIHRVLKSNGFFIMMPTAWSTSKSPLQNFFSWLLNLSSNFPNFPEATLSTISKNLEKSNFTVSHKIIDIEKSQVLLIFGFKQEPTEK